MVVKNSTIQNKSFYVINLFYLITQDIDAFFVDMEVTRMFLVPLLYMPRTILYSLYEIFSTT